MSKCNKIGFFLYANHIQMCRTHRAHHTIWVLGYFHTLSIKDDVLSAKMRLVFGLFSLLKCFCFLVSRVSELFQFVNLLYLHESIERFFPRSHGCDDFFIFFLLFS